MLYDKAGAQDLGNIWRNIQEVAEQYLSYA